MQTKRSGICVAGNMVLDILYPIEKWPVEGQLVTVAGKIGRSTGGAVCNVIMDLARLDPELPLTALGLVGKDAEGDYILNRLGEYKNISVSEVAREGTSSFTMVMSNESNKQRTFFFNKGASAVFDESFIKWENINAELLHIGYILLLDRLDGEDAEFGTRMARLLHNARSHGIKTSIDVVSETGGRFRRIVPPALKYTDYCVINEVEAEQSTGIKLREGEALLVQNMRPALQKLMEMGVSTWAVIHCPEGGYGLDRNGGFVALPSLKLPAGYIKGTVGAGDAFCAGVIYAAQQGKSLEEGVTLGIASAACSLSQSDAASGMRTAKEAMQLYNSLR